jgi:phosphatidate cytidylyltransferase
MKVVSSEVVEQSLKDVDERNTRKGNALGKRVLAALIYIPCLFVITRRGGLYYLALIDVMILIGLWEFYRMMESKGLRPYKALGILCGLALPWYIYFRQGIYANFFLSIVFLGVMTLELVRKDKGLAIYHISVTIFGVIYIGWLGSHLILLRELPHQKGLDYSMGYSFVMVVFIVTWFYDTGAFTFGSIWGRHHPFPTLSPGKTIEGIIGGFVFAIASILIARSLIAPYLSVLEAVGLALIASVIGQLGDLAESMIKRDVKIKDTSKTIPGHGGVLDRFDSLLFTAPVMYYIFKYFILD